MIVNGLSNDHRDYLAAGGYGFMIGDGRLSYGPELIAETYYQALVMRHIFLAAGYQFVAHPAYNRDRGPVHVLTARLHVEI
jgi:high affinity Mn2+ porin